MSLRTEVRASLCSFTNTMVDMSERAYLDEYD